MVIPCIDYVSLLPLADFLELWLDWLGVPGHCAGAAMVRWLEMKYVWGRVVLGFFNQRVPYPEGSLAGQLKLN